MPRPSVIPDVRVRLEAYLNDLEMQFRLQEPEDRRPTLPATSDGKVNVRAVATAIDLRSTQEKYLYERPELSSLINLVAEGQGLLPIGARVLQSAGDDAVRARLAQQAKTARVAGQAAIEAQAMHDEMLTKLRDAGSEIERLRAENLRLRAQLDAMDSGMRIRIPD